MKKMSLLIVSVLLGFMISCDQTVSTNTDYLSYEWEMQTLTSEDELNILLSRGDENIVDWQLSKEFAELWLIYGQESGEYPSSAELLPLPIAIYSSDGDIKFYEFRIIDNDKLIGSIVGAATKDYGCPIVFEGKSSGYSVDLKKLYDRGKLTNDDLPRIIDDGYPSVVVGRTTLSKGVNGDFNEYINLESGETVQKGEIKQIVSYDEARDNYPELFDGLSEEDIAKMEAEIAKYNQDAEKFWNVAVESKGNILAGLSKGMAKNYETSLENYYNNIDGYKGSRMENYWEYIKKQPKIYYVTYDPNEGAWKNYNYGMNIINYEAGCGLVAAGFVLDYLTANGLAPSWYNLKIEEKGQYLKKEMYAKDVVIAGKWTGRMTWPHNLGNSISKWSDYKRTVSGCICPEKAIDQGLPGISLRLMKPTSWNDFKGGPHYRAVIAYKKPGWSIFKWWQIKILDLVDCQKEEKKTGKWETYIPAYHFATYNILHK